MAEQHSDELERLVRRLLAAWDAWLDADEDFGADYEVLNAALEALPRQLREHES